MTTLCPKCGSERIAFAHDEAPPWAKAWTKCFACGKRWNLGGPPPNMKDDEELASAPVQTKPQTKEQTMPRFTTEEGKQRWLEAMAKRRGKPRHEKTATGSTAVSTLPAKRATAPITLAEPTVINPPVNGHEHTAVYGIDELIGKLETDLATLRGAKELLERHG